MHGPVTITYHGRPRYVLLAAESWNAERSISDGENARRELEYQFLIEHMDGGLLVADPSLRITDASSAAALILGRSAATLVGTPITDVLPAPNHALLLSNLRQVLRSGEQAQFDLLFDQDQNSRLRIRAFSWVEGVALLLRVSHDADEGLRLAEQAALERARQADGGIEILRLDVHGTVATAEVEFARRLGLTREKILDLRFADLLAMEGRPRARRAIEQVLGGRSPAEAFDAHLLSDGADEIAARVALAPIAHGYTVGGAMVIVTFGREGPTTK